MKNKPTRHKELNTFKFQNFAERISNIDIDVFHRVGHENETETEDLHSNFYECVQKWNLLNLTEGYSSFKKELKPHTLVTLPQLLLDKNRVIHTLLKHLKLGDPLSLQPLLDIVVSVAKDLRKDFYEFYKEFFEVIISLLNTKDTEQLEWTFTCLAYLFKFLWRPLVKDITTVFNLLLPLLSSTRPDYITGFAAESFAFVARKVRDWPSFLSHILKTVRSRKDGVVGSGKLFFGVIHGVNGHFHSCADTILPFLLESLSSQGEDLTLFEILEQLLECVFTGIHPQKNGLITQTLLIRARCLLKSATYPELGLVLKLLGQLIEFKSGKILQDYGEIIGVTTTILRSEVPYSILEIATQICILLLLSRNIKLQQEQTSGITREVLALKHESLFLFFVDNTHDFVSFDAVILPVLLRKSVESKFRPDYCKSFVKLILDKAPLCGCGTALKRWTKYGVNYQLSGEIQGVFLERLNYRNFDEYLNTVVVLPHLVTDYGAVTKALSGQVMDLLAQSPLTDKLQFLLLNSLECLVHIGAIAPLLEIYKTVLDVLCKTVGSSILSLKTIDLVLTALQGTGAINSESLSRIAGLIGPHFSSPYHEFRLLATHIFTLFEALPEFDLTHSSDLEIPKEAFQVFSFCHRIEAIDSQVETYREQLQYLEKLNFDKPQMVMCCKTPYRTLPLRYLCGALYRNFKLLWAPICAVLETHARGFEPGEFWGVFGTELRSAAHRIEEQKTVEALDDVVELQELYTKSMALTGDPDFVNYRLLLWRALDLFPELAEVKTRDVSDILLDFIEREYTKGSSDTALRWNIKQRLCSDEAADEGYEEESDSKDQKAVPKLKRANLTTLLAILPIFTKVRSPKSMYREPELNKLYFDLLQHKHHQVQKLALDCIMTYKHKFLVPYKDNLYNLIDEKEYKNELSTFHIARDNNIVHEEHRADLIPVILRIVFSKMTSRIGLRTGGKTSGQLRRQLVFRFLAGCEEQEMLTFTKMAFRFYAPFLSHNLGDLMGVIERSLDLESFIPPKRLQSSLNLLNVILDHFGGLMGNELLTFILDIVFVLGGIVKRAFDELTGVHAGYLGALRGLRTGTVKVLQRFFEQFDEYPWTSAQINTSFELFIWPFLGKLTVEGIHSPTNLLKLFVQWGSNPRYFPLLVKEANGELPLPHILSLYLDVKSHTSVVGIIEEMLEKLLSLEASEVLPVDNVRAVSTPILERVQIDEKLNYGSCILLPHIPQILEKFKQRLETKRNLSSRQLFILSRISELVWESEISDKILTLLLPVVLKRSYAGEESLTKVLLTVKNLLLNSGAPLKHLKTVTPLFNEVSYPAGRKLLLEILAVMYSEPSRVLDVLNGLNSFDAKWVEQPDFERRHLTFKGVLAGLQTQEIDLDLGILLVYNCFYFMKTEKDLSIREHSLECLKKLAPYLVAQNPTDTDYILSDTYLLLIRHGMKAKGELRSDALTVLGALSRECAQHHIVLRNLHLYTCPQDLEVDFFENITHLQLHRHTRGLLRFCTLTRDLTVGVNVRSLTQFILPIATYYLCNDKYQGKNSVIDAAIECVGVVSRVLPWHQYETLLKFYLDKLRRKVEHQKQLVRIIIVILDAFHFDLSKGQVQSQAPEVVELEVPDVVELEVPDVVDQEPELQLDELGDGARDEEEPEEATSAVKISEKVSRLCKSTASRVVRSIQQVLMPQLHRTLAELTQYDTTHKLNRKKLGLVREEEDLLRIPISLALVKLLQRLPQELLHAHLPRIFMKLCTFLRSDLESVRRVTRDVLQKIMQALGPGYLYLLLEEMKPLLSRGFHSHVLVYTVHSVLSCLREQYQPGDIDGVLLTVLELCRADLFGTLSEEKDVVKIAVKTSEAKATKSFDTFQILGQYITEKCLMDLILPLKHTLQETRSFKAATKAQESLRHITLGLADNVFIDVKSLLIFAYGTASESIPALIPQPKGVTAAVVEQEQPADCFIIPKAPVGRSGIRHNNVKSSKKANAHLLVEFGLRLLLILLKRSKLRDQDFNPYLDPFVGVFSNCLKAKHIKLGILTLQCLGWVLKFDVPSMKDSIKDMSTEIFAILHKYAAAGLSKGDNFDLVVAAFKTMAILVRDVKYFTVDTEQLKILLLYAEQDMHDYDRQATAFNLLKAIITRKLVLKEIEEVMVKVAELSVTSELSHVRAQARAVFHQYVMDYPLGNKLEKHVAFYVSQMEYELQFGRESAIEMIQTFVTTFPMKMLVFFSGTFFVTLGARLVNDEVPDCRKKVAECLSSMLSRLGKKLSDPLFDIILVWLADKKVSHRRLAAQLCGVFVTVEKATFETRLPQLLPLILRQFSTTDVGSEEEERLSDHHLFQVLQMLLKICVQCPGFLKTDVITDLGVNVQRLLGYPHEWVRLSAAQFLGHVLASLNIEDLGRCLADNTSGVGYLFDDPTKGLKSLTLDLCDQLQPGLVKSELAEQVIKNLVVVARVMAHVKTRDESKLHLVWLTKRMRKIVNVEVVQSPTSIVLRREVFKWIAGVATVLTPESISEVLNHLLAPLIREMITTEESNAPLRQLSKEVAGIIKRAIGVEMYTERLSSLQQSLSVKRAERKRSRTQLAVTDPEGFAKKKLKRHEKKKESKKRKVEALKGKKTFKRRKVVDLDPEV